MVRLKLNRIGIYLQMCRELMLNSPPRPPPRIPTHKSDFTLQAGGALGSTIHSLEVTLWTPLLLVYRAFLTNVRALSKRFGNFWALFWSVKTPDFALMANYNLVWAVTLSNEGESSNISQWGACTTNTKHFQLNKSLFSFLEWILVVRGEWRM